MDTFSGRGSRQQVPLREPVAQQSEPMASAPVHHHPVATKKTDRPRRKLLWVIPLIIAVVALAWYLWVLFGASGVPGVKSGQYQAVFLTNGQVYFGKLQNTSSNSYALSDVFYLQAAQADAAANPQKTTETSSDVQLIKLGNEVHGPEDSMVIDKSQVLFFENLKTDGKVAKTITDYHNKNK